jgi:hypothetical protein
MRSFPMNGSSSVARELLGACMFAVRTALPPTPRDLSPHEFTELLQRRHTLVTIAT